MDRGPDRGAGAVVAGVGAALFFVAVSYHLGYEWSVVGRPEGPLLAVVVDGSLACGIVYAGLRLRRADLPPEHRWRVATWTLAGMVLFLATMTATVLIRQLEGRTVAEPMFVLLVTAEVGAVAGYVTGYYNARVRADAERTERARLALGFANRVLRHDLKNDLMVIRGRADAIAAATGDEDVREWASDIDDYVEQAEVTVDNTGAIAETLLGTEDDDGIDLTELVEEVIERYAETTDVTVEADLPDAAPVAANGALRSVVTNLIENAVEHSGGETVATSVVVDGDDVVLSVADDGVGVPDEQRESLFEPRDDVVHGGGLHLVATLVDRFGGSIDVSDRDPQGTVFTVELPRARP